MAIPLEKQAGESQMEEARLLYGRLGIAEGFA
jgi:hypothetical protein